MATGGVGTVENGIELVGQRDKFLSIKWEPVEDASSYAVFKEVRDIWDLQGVTEVPKDTLGALRPGNKYLIRVLALDSSGCRLKVLGPATFSTDGPEDKRQPKVKLDALEQNWTEVLGSYPAPAAKVDPYSGPNACPYHWQCTLKDNPAHCTEYNHLPKPLACPNGAGCMLISQAAHANQFTH